MRPVVIYHNPRCSKSRETLHLIRDKNIEPTIIEYMSARLSIDTLKQILSILKITPRELLRKNEKLYEELKLENPDLSDAALITAMIEHPVLIERPIVIIGNKGVIGRPPENVLEIL